MKSRQFLLGILVGVLLTVVALGIKSAFKPKMPVQVSFRQALVDRSLVAVIQNNSDSVFKVAFELVSNETSTSKRGELILAPYEPVEIGWAQGWRFVPGELITLKNTNYRTHTVAVPQLASR